MIAEIAGSLSGKEGVSTSGFAAELATGSANSICDNSSCKRAVWCFNSSASGSLAAGPLGASGTTSAGAGFNSKNGARLDKSTPDSFAGASTGAKSEAGWSDGRVNSKIGVVGKLGSGSGDFAGGSGAIIAGAATIGFSATTLGTG